MKYYLCLVGNFEGSNIILEHCLEKNVYQYHEDTRQKGAGVHIVAGDIIILGYKSNNQILAYGIALGSIGETVGYEDGWMAVKVQQWIRIDEKQSLTLPYGVFWHTLIGNKQSVVKQIDELWANVLITQIIWRKQDIREPVSPAINLHLGTIVALLNQGLLSIPAVQRGKVWNATRVEVLWDSLLRGIPIGSLVIKPNKKEWELLDGQQRVNAISMGFQNLENCNEQSILWLDIMPNKEEVKKNRDRVFFFRVTTTAHPWGYNLSDDETSNSTLNSQEKREAVDSLETIDQNWKTTQDEKKPSPLKLWPFKASFPVPFSILRQFFERNPNGRFEDFWFFCKSSGHIAKSNWFVFLDNKIHSCVIDDNAWNKIRSATIRISSTVIVVQNTISIPNEDIGLYFRRMNKAGIVPNEEEIRYSLLKSKVPDLKYIDHIAEDRMMPARMANIAMTSYLTQKKGKWISVVDLEDVTGLAQDIYFSDYIYHKLGLLRDKIENWIIYRPQDNPIGIPKILYSKMAKTGRGELYKLLLLFAEKWDNLDSTKLVALISLIDWFGNEAMISHGYNLYFKDAGHTQDEWNKATSKWVFDASFWNNYIAIPPPVSIFLHEKIQSIEDLWAFHDNYAYIDAISKIWEWTTLSGRAILLYACRSYLNKEFGQYDPADAAWSEENCPWDYDHIIPQNWIRKCNASGKFHNEVKLYINSIGNIAPVSFSINRKKKDSAPLEKGGYIEDYGKALSATPDDYVRFDGNNVIEYDQDLTLLLASITAKRFCTLYSAWYQRLNIDDLFEYRDPRRSLIERIEKKLKESNLTHVITVFVNSKLQYACITKADWSRQWIAIGIDLGEEKNIFPAVAVGHTNNLFQVEAGLRRHPKRTSIDGKDYWYKDGIASFMKTYPADYNIDELADIMYDKLIVLYNEASHVLDEQSQ